MAGKSVGDLMSKNVTTVAPDASAEDAAKLIKREDVGPLPVVENGRLVGIVTDRDLVVRVLAEGRDPAATAVRDAASHDLVTVSADQNLDKALRLLAEHQVRRLPVVEGDRLVGIVAQADVARAISATKTGEVVGDISR
jgi:CBS domain-containing protein